LAGFEGGFHVFGQSRNDVHLCSGLKFVYLAGSTEGPQGSTVLVLQTNGSN
jgi:hypothetical protein